MSCEINGAEENQLHPDACGTGSKIGYTLISILMALGSSCRWGSMQSNFSWCWLFWWSIEKICTVLDNASLVSNSPYGVPDKTRAGWRHSRLLTSSACDLTAKIWLSDLSCDTMLWRIVPLQCCLCFNFAKNWAACQLTNIWVMNDGTVTACSI